jgi:tripartite-type tricarboxylate transporter receptor subunit TctC
MLRLARPFLLGRVVGLLLLTFTVSAVACPLAAQTWPSRPLTMVVPYAPGGSTDLVARLLAPGLGAALGQPVLLENMAGVGGIARGDQR